MTSYCGYCGRPLEEGELCFCPKAVAARAGQAELSPAPAAEMSDPTVEQPMPEGAEGTPERQDGPDTPDPSADPTPDTAAPTPDAAPAAGWNGAPAEGMGTAGSYPPPFIRPKNRLAPQLADAFGRFWNTAAVDRLCTHGEMRTGYLLLAISWMVTALLDLILTVGTAGAWVGGYLYEIGLIAAGMMVFSHLTAGLLAVVSRICGRKVPFRRAFLAYCTAIVPSTYLSPVLMLIVPFCVEITPFSVTLNVVPLAVLMALMGVQVIAHVAICHSGLAGEKGAGDRATLVMMIAYGVLFLLLFLLIFVLMQAALQSPMMDFGSYYGFSTSGGLMA